MSTHKVLCIEEFRGRREGRYERTLALHASDLHRHRILGHLWQAVELAGADRAATVWVDEYGPGLAHPHTVLDVGSDAPRRGFSVDLLQRAWEGGVPGTVDVADERTRSVLAMGHAPRSTFAVSLGSDGLRAWFMVVDALAPRTPLSPSTVEELLFLAGECTGILLHRDLDGRGDDSAPKRFTAWPVLRDVDEDDTDPVLNRRITCRFLVIRAVQHVLEDELSVEQEELEEQIGGVRREIGGFLQGDREKKLWNRTLDALLDDDRSALCGVLIELGQCVEDQAHWHGASEHYRTAHELAAALGVAEASLDAGRALGRIYRKMGRWEDAVRWYSLARDASASLQDASRQARAMDGLATVHINRGNMPLAREILDQAVPIAEAGSDPNTRAAIFHSMMTVAHTEGRLDTAARFGWRAVDEYRDEPGKLRALTALGGVFLEGRELRAAEDAFAIAASRLGDQVFKLYALEGLAHVAALSGSRELYESRLAELEAAGFDSGPPEFRAEALLERGDGYLALGDDAEARRWYRRALEVAEEHAVNEYLIRAEESIGRLERAAKVDVETAPAPLILDEREMEEIRGGLRAIRAEWVGAGA